MSKLQKFLDGKGYVPILTRFFGLHFGPFFANSSGHPGSQFGCFLLKLKNQEEQRASPKQVAKFLLPKKNQELFYIRISFLCSHLMGLRALLPQISTYQVQLIFGYTYYILR
jgi:hypothetical protein